MVAAPSNNYEAKAVVFNKGALVKNSGISEEDNLINYYVSDIGNFPFEVLEDIDIVVIEVVLNNNGNLISFLIRIVLKRSMEKLSEEVIRVPVDMDYNIFVVEKIKAKEENFRNVEGNGKNDDDHV